MSEPRFRVPIHCRDRYDCSTWATESRTSSEDRNHSQWVHAEQDEMWTAFRAWVEATVILLRKQERIGPADLPHPADPTVRVKVSLFDPSTAMLLAGDVQFKGQAGSGSYVCFVVQTPTGTWRATTGFFLAHCHACDPTGDKTYRGMESQLRPLGVQFRSVWDLPEALHSREDWFHPHRLQLGAIVEAASGRAGIWCPGRPAGAGPAMVATGPVTTTLANIVYLDNARADVPVLERLRGPAEKWWHRVGSAGTLARLAGIELDVATLVSVTRSRPADAPAAWGAFAAEDGIWHGPVPNLQRTLLELLPRHRQHPALLTCHLPAGQAARLAEITAITTHQDASAGAGSGTASPPL